MIKNKDGTVYKLVGVNPLMKEQDQWGKFVIHNFNWDKESQPVSTPEPVALKSDFVLKENKEEVKPVLVQNIPNKFTSHCLPVVIEMHTDSLYGETKNISKYGNKFMFEFFLISQDDMSIVFWTDIKLENGSIIYPITKDKRWWKINKSEKKEEGFLYGGINSDICPDFT